MNRLCDSPSARISSRRAGPTARYRARVGGSFQAKMSRPVTLNALATAWPGSGLPKVSQSRTIHGAKTTSEIAPTATTRRSCPARHPISSQISPSQIASLRVRAARPITTPSAITRRSITATGPIWRAILLIRRQAINARTVNSIVESGRAEWISSGR